MLFKLLSILKMSSFPLPRAAQQYYSEFFEFKIKKGTFKNYTIQWVGVPLTCRYKSESINDVIGSHSVFILQNGDMYEYAVYDSSKTFYRLPARFFSTCFPGIQQSKIPANNRVKIKISKDKTIIVPFIPASFLTLKQGKTKRTKRKRSNQKISVSNRERIDFSTTHPEWRILSNVNVQSNTFKRELMILIRALTKRNDENLNFEVSDPFLEITSLEELKKSEKHIKLLKVVLGFVFHYCRTELGCPMEPKTTSVEEWIEGLNSVEKQ